MKKLLLSAIFFLGLLPCIKNYSLSFVSIQQVLAQTEGDGSEGGTDPVCYDAYTTVLEKNQDWEEDNICVKTYDCATNEEISYDCTVNYTYFGSHIWGTPDSGDGGNGEGGTGSIFTSSGSSGGTNSGSGTSSTSSGSGSDTTGVNDTTGVGGGGNGEGKWE